MHQRITRVEYNPDLEKLTRKKRVCAYARVSSDKDEAFHSLSAQISYYQTKIAAHPEWEFVEVFTDLGLTGTKENRDGFQRMLTACREGKVDIVLTKSITRFARNTVTLLETIRELKNNEIDIHFEEEGLRTLSAQGELMISILAARAQEESRQVSENQKWHYRRSYEKGIPVVGRCLGYRLINHQLVIVPEEAETVRMIFAMYLSGMGLLAIARQLKKRGRKTIRGNESWCRSAIREILTNEKYKGDLVLQKRYVTDYISKKKKYNHGERPQYHVEDSHDAIIDRDIFEKVQTEIDKRGQHCKRTDVCKDKKFLFSHLIFCTNCGSQYYRRKQYHKGVDPKPMWRSFKYDTQGKDACICRQIPEEVLIQKTCMQLGVDSLDGINLADHIECIQIPSQYEIVFKLKNGTVVSTHWEHRSRSKKMDTGNERKCSAENSIKKHRKGGENHEIDMP